MKLKTSTALMAMLLGSSLLLTAQNAATTTTKELTLPPLPPGLPADAAKAAPQPKLTEDQRAALAAGAELAAKNAMLERAKALAEFEKHRHGPLISPGGDRTTVHGLVDLSRAALPRLAADAREQHRKESAEVEQWLNLQKSKGLRLPTKRPVRIESGRPVFSDSRSLQSAQLSKVDRVWPGGAAGLSLSGSGFKIGVWEELYPLNTHPEYAGRVMELDNAAGWLDRNAHATLVVGTIAATGIDALAKGMAYESSILAYGDFQKPGVLRAGF